MSQTAHGARASNDGTATIHRDPRLGPPAMPVAPAPARFNEAGISAGEDALYKTSVPMEHGWAASPGVNGLARGLGWFSIALGAAEIIGGRTIACALGMKGSSGLLRAFGVREVGNGVGLLMQNTPSGRMPWVWGRVAGDAMDLAVLGMGLDEDNDDRDRVGAAMTAVGTIAAIDLLCALLLSDRRER